MPISDKRHCIFRSRVMFLMGINGQKPHAFFVRHAGI
jgi:hypothetical protein